LHSRQAKEQKQEQEQEQAFARLLLDHLYIRGLGLSLL
jgi:hypothetical protein